MTPPPQPTGFSPLERRKFIRVMEGSPLTFVTSRGKSGEGELMDISLRGMRFVSEQNLTVGEKIRTVFILTNGISLDLSGVVRHRQGKAQRWIYGVEFSIQDYKDLKEHIKLNDYIIRTRAEQDRILRREILKRRGA